jgi:hypothetical protein
MNKNDQLQLLDALRKETFFGFAGTKAATQTSPIRERRL